MNKATVTFTLKNKQTEINEKNQKPTTIFLLFNYGYFLVDDTTNEKKYKPLKYTTGQKVKPIYFIGAPAYRVKQTSLVNHTIINKELNNIQEAIVEVYKSLSTDGYTPTPLELKEAMDVKLKRKNANPRVVNKDFLINYIETYEEDITNGQIMTKHGLKFAEHSISDFKYFKKLWMLFEEFNNHNYRFDEIDFQFYNDFINFLRNEYKVGKEVKKKQLMNTTINNNLRLFTKLMKRSKRLKVHNNPIVDEEDWKLLPPSTKEKIALTQSEIKSIEQLDLPYKEYIDSIRDIYLVGIYIAQRYQDYKDLQEINIVWVENKKGEKVDMLQIIQKKGATENKVIIPIWNPLRKIFEKWDYSLPNRGRKQFSRDIKKLGEMAGIDSKITLEYIKGGIKVIETKKKYELMIPHSARRTGITTLDKIMSDKKVRSLSGHKSEAAYKLYVKTTKEESALGLMEYTPF